MKHLLSFLLAFSIFARGNSTDIKIEIRANEVNSLLQFLLSCERNGPDYALYKTVINGKYKNAATDSMLQLWSELEKYNMLKFEGFPETRHNGQSVQNMVFIQSVNSKSVDELVNNCSGFFTQSALKKFSNILHYFYPIYHNQLWKPNEKKIAATVKSLNKMIATKNMNASFSAAATFYGTRWENDLPFYVMVNPLPGEADYTTARPMGNVLIADYKLGDTDYNGWIGVVIHEMCHVLFSNQTREKQYALEYYFTTHPAINYRLGAYNWLDETLATAIGNGWVIEKLNGITDTSEWYHNYYINKNAKAVFPIVKKYLDEKKEMDGQFIYDYIDTFSRAFVDINQQPAHLFSFIDMATDTINNELYADMFRYFNPRVISCETPLNETTLLKTDHQIHAKLFLITRENIKQIETMNQRFGLNIDTTNCVNKVFYSLEKNGKNYLVFSLSDPSKFRSVLKLFNDQKTLMGTSGSLEIKE